MASLTENINSQNNINESEEKKYEKLILVSKEGDKIETNYYSMKKYSKLISTILDEDDDDTEEREIPLTNVTKDILELIIKFCDYHYHHEDMKEIDKPLNGKLCDIVSKWDYEFISIEQNIIFELILGANYMDIQSLLDLSCAKVASLIKGKTPEEIRLQFNIENDFTPEEEAQIKEENKWGQEE
jgi:S-phase kinase-associated protein 1